MLALPDFRDSYLDRITVCTLVCAEAGWPEDDFLVEVEQPGCWMALGMNRVDDHHGHIHFEIAGDPMEPTDGTPVKKALIEEAWKHLETFVDAHADISVTAYYSVPVDDLPRRGLLRALSGLSTKVCGNQVSLTGGTMAIEGDLFTELRWKLDPDEGNEVVGGRLFGRGESKISDGILTNAFETARDGLNCFVFERKQEGRKHGEENRGPDAVLRRAQG